MKPAGRRTHGFHREQFAPSHPVNGTSMSRQHIPKHAARPWLDGEQSEPDDEPDFDAEYQREVFAAPEVEHE